MKIFNGSLACSTVTTHTYLVIHVRTHKDVRAGDDIYKHHLFLCLSLNLLSRVRHIIVFMAQHIYTEIFHLHIL